MKKRFKQLVSLLFSLIMMMTLFSTTIHAATINDGGYSGYWVYTPNGKYLAGGSNMSPQHIHYYGSTPAYCIEPTVAIRMGEDVYQTSSLEEYNNLSASVKAKISEISYFGFGYSGRNDELYYLATQVMIWQLLSSNYNSVKVHYLPSSPKFAHLNNSNDVTSQINNAIAQIQADVNKYEEDLKSPNFQIYDGQGKKVGKAGANASFDKGIVGTTYKVVDLNGVLPSKKLLSNTFSNANVSGSTVKITLDNKDLLANHSIRFLGQDITKLGFRPVILSNNKDQDVIVKGDLADPGRGSITINTMDFSVKVQKNLEKWAEKDLAVQDLTKIQFELRAKKDIQDGQGKVIQKAGTLARNVSGKEVGNFGVNAKGVAEIKNLYPGTYTLKEVSVPDSMILNTTEKEVVLSEAKPSVSVSFENKTTKLEVTKEDGAGKEVEGAKIIIKNEEGNIVDEWESTKESHKIQGLEKGKTYTFEETQAPDGYYYAVEDKFTVNEDGSITKLNIVDYPIHAEIKKVDKDGRQVEGAKIQLIDQESKKVLKEFVSAKDKNEDISEFMVAGKTYILHETEAPFGFKLAKDKTFTMDKFSVNGDLVIQNFINERNHYFVAVEKVDAQDQTKKLKGAEITLFNQDGTVAKDVNGKEAKAITDENGLVIFEVEYNGDYSSYYAMETNAPIGYRINPNKHEVKLHEKYSFAKNDPIKIVVNDEALPKKTVKTGDSTNLGSLVGILVIASLGFFVILKKRKENAE